jgi:hypothetical protein
LLNNNIQWIHQLVEKTDAEVQKLPGANEEILRKIEYALYGRGQELHKEGPTREDKGVSGGDNRAKPGVV